MDDDAERGVVFVLGVSLGLLLMWVIFTARGRRAAKEVFEAAGDLAEDLTEDAGELIEDAGDLLEGVTQSAGKARRRFGF
jgi:hypothetical protein